MYDFICLKNKPNDPYIAVSSDFDVSDSNQTKYGFG